MKIVQVDDFFHPNSGYQIAVLSKYLAAMGHDVTIVTSRPEKIPGYMTEFFSMENIEGKDAEYSAKYGVKIIRIPLWAWISGRAIQKCGFMRTIESLNPDILYMHSEGNIQTMRFIWGYKRLKYPMVIDSHVTLYASQNRFRKLYYRFYRAFLRPSIVKNSLKIIRTQNTPYLQHALGIPTGLTPWISFGSDTRLFHPDAKAKAAFRREHSISENDFLVLYAGKLNRDKRGDFLAESIREKFSLKNGKNMVFVIVGNVPDDDFGAEVERTFASSENRIIRYPTQAYSDLPRFFQAADLCAIPNGASLSFFDMQACGTPVLWRDEDINIERSSHGNAFIFKCLDKADFRGKMEMCANMDPQEYKKVGERAYDFIKKNYDYEDIARQYEAVLVSEYERQKKLKGI